MKNKTDDTLKWYLFDAKDKVLGRLSTQIADALRGKKEVTYAANINPTNKVVIINCKYIAVTGKKEEGKVYYHYSGFHGGIKEINVKDQRAKDATRIILLAVKGMLPKNKLQAVTLKNLYLYNEGDHPHSSAKFVNLEK